jgi:hypothetical protein
MPCTSYEVISSVVLFVSRDITRHCLHVPQINTSPLPFHSDDEKSHISLPLGAKDSFVERYRSLPGGNYYQITFGPLLFHSFQPTLSFYNGHGACSPGCQPAVRYTRNPGDGIRQDYFRTEGGKIHVKAQNYLIGGDIYTPVGQALFSSAPSSFLPSSLGP